MYPAEVFVNGLQVHHVEGYALEQEGWDVGTPEPRAAVVEYARRHGGVNDTSYLGMAVASLRLGVWGDTFQQLHQRLDTLRGRLIPGTDVPLVWTPYTGANKRRMLMRLGGKIDTLPVNGLISFVGFTLVSSSSPLAFSDTLHESSYDPTLSHSGTGVTFDLTFDLTFTGTADTSSDKVFNAGNIATPPVFVIHGPVTNPVVQNITSGKEITATASLSAGETLWVDVARRTARLNGEDGTLRLDLIDEGNTEWFDLDPGVNELRLTGTGMNTGQTSLVTKWRDAWLP